MRDNMKKKIKEKKKDTKTSLKSKKKDKKNFLDIIKIKFSSNKEKKFSKDSSMPKYDPDKKFKKEDIKKSKDSGEELDMDYFKKKLVKKSKKKIPKKRRYVLRDHIIKAGLEIKPKSLPKNIFNISILLNLLISLYLMLRFSYGFGFTWTNIIYYMSTLWTFGLLITIFFLWAMFYLYLDLRIFKRNIDIEEVLPDYLQLAASNIKAGMTIDRALWYAVRPRFGVLAKEVEVVAKETMAGKDLKEALKDMSDKYDAPVLKRAISLLIEGIEAGGEIGELLIRISSNIKETKIMKQEMAANVTTYVIFITFASIVAAPILFSLSGVLIQVIHNLGSVMDTSSTASTGFALSFKGSGVSYEDFRTFVIITLSITSFFSAAITATIKTGSIKSGIKYIPIYISSSVLLYLLAQSLMNLALSSFG